MSKKKLIQNYDYKYNKNLYQMLDKLNNIFWINLFKDREIQTLLECRQISKKVKNNIDESLKYKPFLPIKLDIEKINYDISYRHTLAKLQKYVTQQPLLNCREKKIEAIIFIYVMVIKYFDVLKKSRYFLDIVETKIKDFRREIKCLEYKEAKCLEKIFELYEEIYKNEYEIIK